MIRRSVLASLATGVLGLSATSSEAATILYQQDFENPTGWVNRVGDLDFVPVNNLYGNQPPGFQFGNTFTVETLLVGGNVAWNGQGYRDPDGRGGTHVIGMLSTAQDDLLGLSFNVGAFKFLNFQLDVSSIDLNCCGGPFDASNVATPVFRISLFDNPGGAVGLGSGALLDFEDIAGTIGPNSFTFDWTRFIVALDATGRTDGNVTVRIDLLTGGYAAIDNFIIAASDDPGDVGSVPEPGTLMLLALSLLALGVNRGAKPTRR